MDRETVQVLLLEDSAPDADLVRALLHRAGGGPFGVHHVVRLADALAVLRERAFDVALVDCNVPDSRGLETFAAVHAAAPQLPVVVLTNVEDEGQALEAVRGGAQDYLIKRQVDTALLVRSLRYAIARQRAEEALRESEERYALAVRGSSDALFDWNVVSGSVYYSPRWSALLGLGPEQLEDHLGALLERVHPEEREALEGALTAHLRAGGEHFEREIRVRHRDGDDRWVFLRAVTVRDGSGRAVRVVGSVSDVTGRHRAEEQILHDALHDRVTGLPNRSLFLDRVGQALQRRRQRERSVGVLWIGLDRFKGVNDTLGFSAGDRVLDEVGERLRALLRRGDTVARVGADEFAMLTTELKGAGDASHLAERVLEALRIPLVVDGKRAFVTGSVGVAIEDGAGRAEDLLRDAAIAMFRAKAAGKDRHELFDRDMHAAAMALLKMEADLRLALERREFVMHYQPIVSLTTPMVVGFEALVRWRHPQRGLVAPQQFIAIAEETGLIVPLGWWVLEEACRQMGEWQRAYRFNPPLAVSVNVSGRLFWQAEMVDRVVAALEAAQLGPSSLRLEITENILMDHGDAALGRLHELRALGVQLHVDDFGTGYSSLSYLQRFHYDTLKIDRSFVGSVCDEADAAAIVQTIVNLANLLGMNVIAEGVETFEQFERLREMRCPQGQGFWFARPMDSDGVESLLAEGGSWRPTPGRTLA